MKTRHFATLFLFLLVHLFIPHFAPATETSTCAKAAVKWIKELQSQKEEILLVHSRDKCSYASTWVKKLNEDKVENRDRPCKDLILISTHKEYVYFRDYADAAAYTPCKGWTRSMYEKCMKSDVDWFTK